MKVLVTGGAGFIGSHLCKDLLNQGHFVYCVDNLLTGRRENILELEGNKNFCFISADVSKAKIDLEVKYIFHLASPASPVDYQNLPLETMFANSNGTENMLRLGVDNKARFVLASTSEVYGDPLEHPQKETYNGNVSTTGPRACYDESKRYAETLTKIFEKKYALDVRIVRIFNTYGPNMRKDDGRVVSNFINQAIANQPLTVYGKGEQTRSFCYVDDMVKGLNKLMFNPDIKGEIVNIGNPHEVTILELAELIRKLVGSSSEIIFKPLPQNDPQKRCPDITKAKEILKWEPQIELKQGLQETIKYFKGLK